MAIRHFTNYKYVLILFIFLLGLLFYVIYSTSSSSKEFMTDSFPFQESDNLCPDILIQKDSVLLLYNSKQPESDTNPIPFYSMDDYLVYVESLNQRGQKCPILVLQSEITTQGRRELRYANNPTQIQRGYIAPPHVSIEKQQSETVTYPFQQFGSSSTTQGQVAGTSLSKSSFQNNLISDLHSNSNNGLSFVTSGEINGQGETGNYPGFDASSHNVGQSVNDTMDPSINPMSPGWKGIMETQRAVDSGKFVGSTVTSIQYNPITW